MPVSRIKQYYARYAIGLYISIMAVALYLGRLDFIPVVAWLDFRFHTAMILNGLLVVGSVIDLKRQPKSDRTEIPSWLVHQYFYLVLIFFCM